MKTLLLILTLFTIQANAGNPAVIFGSGGKGLILPANGLEFNGGQTVSDNDILAFKYATGTGINNGGQLSINTATTFDVAEGCGFISSIPPAAPELKKVNWSTTTGITATHIAAGSTSSVYVDSDGNILQKLGFLTPVEERNYILLGTLFHASHVAIEETISNVRVAYGGNANLHDLTRAIGPVNMSGNVYSANGANLNIDKSAGEIFFPGSNYETDHANPNIKINIASTATSFTYLYQDGSGGATGSAPVSVINPDLWDDGSGTLASVSPNKWTVQRIYYSSGIADEVIQYGQAEYSNVEEAAAGISVEPFIRLQARMLFRAWLIVKKGCTDLSSTCAHFVAAGKFGQTQAGGGVASIGDLQTAYDNSTQPQMILDSVREGFQIRDASTPIAVPLFSIMSNDGLSEYFNVDVDKVAISDKLYFGESDFTMQSNDSVNPSSTATNGEPGDVYFHNGSMFIKNDSGITTNWRIGAIPSYTGQSGKTLYTGGTYVQWRDTEETVRRVRGNLLECPSFESCLHEGVVTVSTSMNMAGTQPRTTQVAAFDTTNYYLSTLAEAVSTYTYTKTSGDFKDKQMVAYCELKTLAEDATFSVEVDGVEIASIDIVKDKDWLQYKIPFVGGSTDFAYIVEATTDLTNVTSIDNCYIGRSDNEVIEISNGITDAVEYAPNIPNVEESNNIAFYSRVGEYLHVQGRFLVTSASAGFVRVELPSGLEIDATKVSSTSDTSVGSGYWQDSGTAFKLLTAKTYNSTGVGFFENGGTGTFNGSLLAANDIVTYNFRVPIVGWTTGETATIVQQETELTAKTANDFSAVINSGSATFSNTNYDWIDHTIINGTGDVEVYFKSDAGVSSPNCTCATKGAHRNCTVYTTNATYVRFLTTDLSGTATNDLVHISCHKQGTDVNKSQKIIGNFSQIKSDDLISIKASRDTSQTLTDDIYNQIVYDSVASDSVGASNYNSTTGTFTSPRYAKYLVCPKILITSALWNAGNVVFMQVDLSMSQSIVVQRRQSPATVTRYLSLGKCEEVSMATNETMKINVFQGSGSDKAVYAGAEYNTLTIQELPDTQSIVANIMKNQTRVCETKYLSADVTSTGVIADLTFSDLEVGKNYSVTGNFSVETTTSGDGYVYIKWTNGDSILSNRWRSDGSGVQNSLNNTLLLTATNSTLLVSVDAIHASSKIHSIRYKTFLQVCKEPDTTILK